MFNIIYKIKQRKSNKHEYYSFDNYAEYSVFYVRMEIFSATLSLYYEFSTKYKVSQDKKSQNSHKFDIFSQTNITTN